MTFAFSKTEFFNFELGFFFFFSLRVFGHKSQRYTRRALRFRTYDVCRPPIHNLVVRSYNFNPVFNLTPNTPTDKKKKKRRAVNIL